MSHSKFSDKEADLSGGNILQKIIKSAHTLRHEFEEGLSERGIPSYLTGPRLRLLVVVSEAGQIRMSDLAAKMDIRAITVTQFVDALEKENLLVRIPDPNDRRATLIQLSNNSLPIIKQARTAAKQVAEKLLEPLSLEMRKQLLEILNILASQKKEPL